MNAIASDTTEELKFKVASTSMTPELTLTLKDINTICSLLERVRPTIKSGEGEFICIEVLISQPKVSDEDLKLVQSYIYASLNQEHTDPNLMIQSVEGWMTIYHEPLTHAQEVRLLFLDDMIAKLTAVLREHHYPF